MTPWTYNLPRGPKRHDPQWNATSLSLVSIQIPFCIVDDCLYGFGDASHQALVPRKYQNLLSRGDNGLMRLALICDGFYSTCMSASLLIFDYVIQSKMFKI
jgi:hypothetical protein